MMCNNFARGNCRSAQICQFAHGDEEKDWFINFMQAADTFQTTSAADKSSAAAGLLQAGQAAQQKLMLGPDMAQNVMAAAQQQLMAGVNTPGATATAATYNSLTGAKAPIMTA